MLQKPSLLRALGVAGICLLALLVPEMGIAQVILPGGGLEGYYSFNGHAGDSSGNAPINHGTNYNGVSYTCGVDSSASNFDGVDDHVKLNTSFDFSGDYTFAAWIRPASTQIGTFFSIRKQCTSYGGGFNRSMISLQDHATNFVAPLYAIPAAFTTTNQVVVSMSRVNPTCTGWHSSYSYTVPGVSIDTNCWTHLAVVCTNNAVDSLRAFDFYINGVWHPDTNHHVTGAANNANAVSPFSQPLSEFDTFFGNTHDYLPQPGQTYPYHGALDEVYIYNRDLTQAEVLTLYQAGFDSLAPANVQLQNTTAIMCESDSQLLSFSLQNSSNCGHDTLWSVNGAVVDSAATFWYHPTGPGIDTVVISMTTSGNCVSIADTQLIQVLAVVVDTVPQTICSGDTFWMGGNFYVQSGAYPDTISTGLCDSVQVLELTVNLPDTTTDTLQSCVGSAVLVGGALQTTAGTYTDVYVNTQGCDSVVLTTLSFFHVLDTVPQTICSGDTFWVGGNFYVQSGTYLDTIMTGLCDSVKVLELTVNLPDTTTDTLQSCVGSAVLIGGALQTTAGTYTDVYVNTQGCDSVVLTTLSFFYVLDTTMYTICGGESLLLNGQVYTQNGTYLDTVTGSPCDTAYVYEIQVLPPVFSTVALSLCIGDSVFAGGSWQYSDGSFQDTLTSAQGCDSIVTTNLSFFQETENISMSLCAGENYLGHLMMQDTVMHDTVLQGACLVARTHQVDVGAAVFGSSIASICSGDSIFLANEWQFVAGNYTDTLQSSTGCDSLHTTTLTVDQFVLDTVLVSLCFGDSLTLNGNVITTPGNYLDTIATVATGCDTLVTYEVSYNGDTLQTLQISVLDSGNCPNRIITLSAGITGGGLLWPDGSTNATYELEEDALVSVTYNHCGRETSDVLDVVFPDCPCFFYFPNAFTPNNNLRNDVYRPVFECDFLEAKMTVFNRWGRVIFKTSDLYQGWDGTIEGSPAPIGVYVVQFEYQQSAQHPAFTEVSRFHLIR